MSIDFFRETLKHLLNKERSNDAVTEKLEDLRDMLRNSQEQNMESTSSYQVMTTLLVPTKFQADEFGSLYKEHYSTSVNLSCRKSHPLSQVLSG